MKLFSSFYSLSVKIPIIVITVLVTGIGIISYYYIRSQNDSIISSKVAEVHEQAGIIYTSIKNNMLAGEAPVAVQLFRDFTRSQIATDIRLFRADGTVAFSDDKTINTVNRNLKKKQFSHTGSYVTGDKEQSVIFADIVANVNDQFENRTIDDKRQIVAYKPLINQPKCSTCHGLDHVVRGVIRVTASMDDAYTRAQNTIILTSILYFFIIVILTFIIVFFIRHSVLLRIFEIGSTVQRVGDGDFSVRAPVKSRDELADLSSRINIMIAGLNERFKLSKFVSRSTLEHVSSDDVVGLGGTKKTMTVLFSDIREFTRFSESKDPEYVLSMLNNIMDKQSAVITNHHGDIDKYVGDEMMAVFEGVNQAERAVSAALDIITSLRKLNEDSHEILNVGIGINTGEMISGNMGSHDRLDRTVIGDEVNLGARLCSIAGPGVIVISENTYNLVKTFYRISEKPPVKIKGKLNPVKVYTVRGRI